MLHVIPNMGVGPSVHHVFYTHFAPRTVHRDDVLTHCREMVSELAKSNVDDECTCGFVGHGPCDVPDFEESEFGEVGELDEAGEFDLDLETSEFDEIKEVYEQAFEKCIDAQVAIAANQDDLALKYTNVTNSFGPGESCAPN